MINVDMICNILECYKEEYHTGPMPIKISLAGNHEPEQKEIQDVLEKKLLIVDLLLEILTYYMMMMLEKVLQELPLMY